MNPDPNGPIRRACSNVAAASTSIPEPIRSTTASAGVPATRNTSNGYTRLIAISPTCWTPRSIVTTGGAASSCRRGGKGEIAPQAQTVAIPGALVADLVVQRANEPDAEAADRALRQVGPGIGERHRQRVERRTIVLDHGMQCAIGNGELDDDLVRGGIGIAVGDDVGEDFIEGHLEIRQHGRRQTVGGSEPVHALLDPGELDALVADPEPHSSN